MSNSLVQAEDMYFSLEKPLKKWGSPILCYANVALTLHEQGDLHFKPLQVDRVEVWSYYHPTV